MDNKVKVVYDKPLTGNAVAPPLKEGESYLVKQTHFCTGGCGQAHYDVGLISKFNFIRCHKCGEVLPNSGQEGIHWAHPSRFIPTA